MSEKELNADVDDHGARLRNALIKQHETIFNYDTNTIRDEFCEYIDCPVCGSCDKTTAFVKDLFNFSKCGNCGMVYLNPRLNEVATYQFYNSDWNAIYNEKKFYSGPATVVDDKRNSANLEFIERIGQSKGKLLEIGIGNGFFLKRAHEHGYKVYGVELNKHNCEAADALLDGAGKIHNADLFSAGFHSDTFDVIYMKDVFEHVPNPKKMLLELNRIAKQGCVLFIEVPNIDGWIYKIVKQRHVCVFAFEHLNYWSPRTLEKALTLAGFVPHSVSHASDDFTPADILSYFIDPSFTSLRMPTAEGFKRYVLLGLRQIVSMPPLKYLNCIFRLSANFFGRGSLIKIVAIKQ